MSLYHPLEEPEGFFGFKLFRAGGRRSRSPTSCRCSSTWASRSWTSARTRSSPRGSAPVWIYDFGLVRRRRGESTPGRCAEIFQDAFARAWRGEVENDGFNRLVLRARLTWRQVTMLRAYAKYLRQTGYHLQPGLHGGHPLRQPPHRPAPRRALRGPLRPEPPGDRRRRSRSACRGEIEDALDEIASLDEDRILRNFLERHPGHGAHQRLPDGPGRASRSRTSRSSSTRSEIPELPLPRPRFEIFVYSPRTEGVHLRGGKVARGGIRWSDRREDFRTEVLGLMKAQMVKNAVIVPVGAKGGFVVKRPPAEGGREALAGKRSSPATGPSSPGCST